MNIIRFQRYNNICHLKFWIWLCRDIAWYKITVMFDFVAQCLHLWRSSWGYFKMSRYISYCDIAQYQIKVILPSNIVQYSLLFCQPCVDDSLSSYCALWRSLWYQLILLYFHIYMLQVLPNVKGRPKSSWTDPWINLQAHRATSVTWGEGQSLGHTDSQSQSLGQEHGDKSTDPNYSVCLALCLIWCMGHAGREVMVWWVCLQ